MLIANCVFMLPGGLVGLCVSTFFVANGSPEKFIVALILGVLVGMIAGEKLYARWFHG